MSPVFVAEFEDGEKVRMSVYCDDGDLDWERGRCVARHAWQARDRQRRIDEMEDNEPPRIEKCHFEMIGGEIIQEPEEIEDTK